ncbi:EpsG family protein [Weissella confusa]|uniref:EpsG family protein n=1 Tax=Weissella confusa TaxID=1583 RepID=UPI0021A75666|nr:EpsG family protein [Weissella confusa]
MIVALLALFIITLTILITDTIISSTSALSESNLIKDNCIIGGILIAAVFILGFRGLTGTDTPAYALVFWNPRYANGMESGFLLLGQLSKSLVNSFSFFQVVVGVLSFVGIGAILWSMRKESFQTKLLLLTFFLLAGPYFVLFNNMRQGITISILLLMVVVINFSNNNNLLQLGVSVILIGTGIFIHKTIVVGIVLVLMAYMISRLLSKIQIPRRNLLLVALTFVGIIIPPLNFSWIMTLLGYVGVSYAQAYAHSSLLMNSRSGTAIVNAVMVLFIVVFSNYMKMDNMTQQSFLQKVSLGMTLLYVIVSPFAGSSELMYRLFFYVLPFIGVTFTEIYKNVSQASKIKRLVIVGAEFLFILLNFAHIVMANLQGILPYMGF